MRMRGRVAGPTRVVLAAVQIAAVALRARVVQVERLMPRVGVELGVARAAPVR
jgi:hypothetical protein